MGGASGGIGGPSSASSSSAGGKGTGGLIVGRKFGQGDDETIPVRRGHLKHMADCIDRAAAASNHAVMNHESMMIFLTAEGYAYIRHTYWLASECLHEHWMQTLGCKWKIIMLFVPR